MKAPRTVSRRRTSEVITKPTPKRTTAPSSSSACEGPWPDHASARRASSAAATPMLAPQTALVAVKKRRSGQMPMTNLRSCWSTRRFGSRGERADGTGPLRVVLTMPPVGATSLRRGSYLGEAAVADGQEREERHDRRADAEQGGDQQRGQRVNTAADQAGEDREGDDDQRGEERGVVAAVARGALGDHADGDRGAHRDDERDEPLEERRPPPATAHCRDFAQSTSSSAASSSRPFAGSVATSSVGAPRRSAQR